jgi:virginiamycin A acetyltransferase
MKKREGKNKKMDSNSIYPRGNDNQTCQLKNIIKNENIIVGDYTYYHDFEDPLSFETKNILYHYPYVNNDKLIIGKFCSIAAGAKFLFNGGNHKNESFVNYPFAIFPELWDGGLKVNESWDNKGDIVVGNDVWIGHEAIIMAGVKIGDGARIATRAIVTKDVKPYDVVGGTPARVLKKRFDEETIEMLLEIKWWDLEEAEIKNMIPVLMNADKYKLKDYLHK